MPPDDLCILCGEILHKEKSVQVTRGLDTLREHCRTKRPDVYEAIKDAAAAQVHERCRKEVTRKSLTECAVAALPGVAAPSTSTPAPPPLKLLRSAHSNFDFMTHCVLCAEPTTGATGLARYDISLVTNAGAQERILGKCDKRGDEWSDMVRTRIISTPDLVQAGARYHRSCYSDFLKVGRAFKMTKFSPTTPVRRSVPSAASTPSPTSTMGQSPGAPRTPASSPLSLTPKSASSSSFLSPPPRPAAAPQLMLPPVTPVPSGRGTRGRPRDASKMQAFRDLCQYLENAEERQFELCNLYSRMGDASVSGCYGEKHLMRLLCAHYGHGIIVTERPGKSTLVGIRENVKQILDEAWCTNKKKTTLKDRQGIVETAAEIILEDIRNTSYDCSHFPTTDAVKEGGWSTLPDTLRIILTSVIMKGKKGDPSSLLRICNAIGRAIVKGVRPRSYVSPLHTGLSVYLHRSYGSKNLIDLLRSFGVCAAYSECTQYERAVIEHAPAVVEGGAFIQFAYDNCDFNVRTIDGLNTFHNMGGIKVVTPATAVSVASLVPRGTTIAATDVTKHGSIPLSLYQRPTVSGLQGLTVVDMRPSAPWDIVDEHVLQRATESRLMDLLWLAGTAFQACDTPGWMGFMERAAEGTTHPAVSAVIPTPFINLDATNLTTISTALEYAVQEADSHGQKTVVITMDQPLFQKAAEMILSAKINSILKRAVPWLGGFHLLMSFLGAIGYLMAGSGLEELWAIVFALIAVQHMLTGKAFARALRAHFLTLALLFALLFERDADIVPERAALVALFNEVLDQNTTAAEALENSSLEALQAEFNKQLELLSASGPQGKLWSQYIHMVMLVLVYIRSVRSADWKLHMHCIREMLPYLVATGHLNYARSVLLHLHLVTDLEQKMTPLEFDQFVVSGYFAVFRSNKAFAGLWGDLVIEQCLMRLFKTRGGMTQGRGITESTKATWIKAMPACIKMMEAVEEYAGHRSQTSEQHVELRKSRQSRNKKDGKKMMQWLREHPPFENLAVLRSLSTGLVAGSTVNCYDAYAVGCDVLGALIGQDFKSIVFSKKNKVLNLASFSSSVKIGERVVAVNSTTLFHRINCVIGPDDLAECFEYELSPVPLSLFDENGAFRKGTKSSLAHAFLSYHPCSKTLPTDAVFVIDGGNLMRKVVWPRPATYREIIDLHVSSVLRHHSESAIVVFDGYPDKPSIKDPEHMLRSSKGTSPDLVFDAVMQVTTTQAKFLTNKHNKSRLISMLMEAFSERGVQCVQAEDDADALVATTAIKVSKEKKQNVVVVAEDTDILALLINFGEGASVFQLLPEGAKRAETKVYDVHGLRTALRGAADVMLVIHAMTGCDSTSALYKKGKKDFLKRVVADEKLQAAARAFYTEGAIAEDIEAAGQQLLLAAYASQSHPNLNSAKCSAYIKTVARRPVWSEIDIGALPPTSAAAKQHTFRVYLQVQMWLGHKPPPEQWGWRLHDGRFLTPVYTRLPPAPDRILKLTACHCQGECGSKCGCVIAGLRCSAMCQNCAGHGCANHMLDIEESDKDNAEDPSSDPDDPGVEDF